MNLEERIEKLILEHGFDNGSGDWWNGYSTCINHINQILQEHKKALHNSQRVGDN